MGGGAGGAFAPMNLKNSDFFVLLPIKKKSYFAPPPRNSVKILPAPWKKTEMTSLDVYRSFFHSQTNYVLQIIGVGDG